MSEHCSNRAFSILLALFLSPLHWPSAVSRICGKSRIEFTPVFADIDDFEPLDSHPYMLPDSEELLYSATRMMKNEWISQGLPGVDIATSPQSMTSGRACTPYNEGDTATVPTSGGSIDVTVEKTTSTAAFMVQSGRTLSSTVLNNWASTWDTTVYPTLMTYFGKDTSMEEDCAPDVDNNCQIEVVIYAIDGAYNIGGYFAPACLHPVKRYSSISMTHLSWSRVILAHELQH